MLPDASFDYQELSVMHIHQMWIEMCTSSNGENLFLQRLVGIGMNLSLSPF